MKVSNMVPEIYYRESRDFAYMGRLFEIIFNYMKTSASCVNVDFSSNESSAMVIELLADTVGFKAKENYQLSDLIAIIGSFQKLLRLKGTKYVVEQLVQIMMNVQNIYVNAPIDKLVIQDADDPNHLIIYLHEELTDVMLLEDLFDYLLPSGMLYSIYRISNVIGASGDSGTIVGLGFGEVSEKMHEVTGLFVEEKQLKSTIIGSNKFNRSFAKDVADVTEVDVIDNIIDNTDDSEFVGDNLIGLINTGYISGDIVDGSLELPNYAKMELSDEETEQEE